MLKYHYLQHNQLYYYESVQFLDSLDLWQVKLHVFFGFTFSLSLNSICLKKTCFLCYPNVCPIPPQFSTCSTPRISSEISEKKNIVLSFHPWFKFQISRLHQLVARWPGPPRSGLKAKGRRFSATLKLSGLMAVTDSPSNARISSPAVTMTQKSLL